MTPAETPPADDDDAEFTAAMLEFRLRARRPFPTWSDALAVAKALGYARTDVAGIGHPPGR